MIEDGSRYVASDKHEAAVHDLLVSLHWQVVPFGQGTFGREFREVLKELPSGLRWTPDLLAAKHFNGRPTVYLIDAKEGRKDTGNYCFEQMAAWNLQLLSGLWSLPGLIVTPDFRVLPVRTALQKQHTLIVPDKRTWSKDHDGTGEPFHLVAKRFAREWTDYFDEPTAYPDPVYLNPESE